MARNHRFLVWGDRGEGVEGLVRLTSRDLFWGFGGGILPLLWRLNLPVAAKASTNPINPAWVPLATTTLTGGSANFADTGWTNYPCRFYPVRSP